MLNNDFNTSSEGKSYLRPLMLLWSADVRNGESNVNWVNMQTKKKQRDRSRYFVLYFVLYEGP